MAGAALECVHCYSLVHDDLPAMDDDDLRRGRPTVHKAFDEATAILAGDALLTFAFDAMARGEVHPDARVRIALVSELARASGVGGMAGGQMLDLAAEGRFAAKRALGESEIVTLAGDEDRRADPLRLPRRRHPRRGGRVRALRMRSTATARPSARPSRSPTICSTSKATRQRSARPPARMPPPARRRWCPRSGRRRARAARRAGGRGRRRAGAVRGESRYTARHRPFHRRARKLKRGKTAAMAPDKRSAASTATRDPHRARAAAPVPRRGRRHRRDRSLSSSDWLLATQAVDRLGRRRLVLSDRRLLADRHAAASQQIRRRAADRGRGRVRLLILTDRRLARQSRRHRRRAGHRARQRQQATRLGSSPWSPSCCRGASSTRFSRCITRMNIMASATPRRPAA